MRKYLETLINVVRIVEALGSRMIEIESLIYRWRISEAVEKLEKKQDNEIYVTDLVYCPLKFRYQKMYKELTIASAANPAAIMGEIIHMGLENLLSKLLVDKNIRSEVEVQKRISVDGREYAVKGRIDAIVDNYIVEIKSGRSDTNIPHKHHVLQLRIYLWLTNYEKGLLFYITPNRLAVFEVSNPLTDSDVAELIKDLIRGEPAPRYTWECSYCIYAPLCSKKITHS